MATIEWVFDLGINFVDTADIYLAAQPWFSRLLPVFQNAVARPSTVTGPSYNKVSTSFFQTTNKILNGEVSVDEGVQAMESRIKRDLR